ncbi:hypothetical protein C0Q70_06590 [Pomacea canaliculata]|uniref:vitamin-K-epoxide reductase (warfarin-sensitive) n=1 Tax=Pomacea canaliculata TaxID=400727 RepID=A0A2T7PCM9_POMCA|nr:hypothetical protein C0Q70_06590 [Pomacea canaliculata]
MSQKTRIIGFMNAQCACLPLGCAETKGQRVAVFSHTHFLPPSLLPSFPPSRRRIDRQAAAGLRCVTWSRLTTRTAVPSASMSTGGVKGWRGGIHTMAGPAYVIISNMADRLLLSLAGLLVSVYSLHVEVQKEKNPKYRAACDFSERMSCSKVLTSKYSRGFGVVEPYLGKKHFLNVRNCNLGIVFYLVHAALGQ